MSKLQRIPEMGDIVEEEGFRFTVQDIKGRRVQRVRIDQLLEVPEVIPPETSSGVDSEGDH